MTSVVDPERFVSDPTLGEVSATAQFDVFSKWAPVHYASSPNALIFGLVHSPNGLILILCVLFMYLVN
jgi:hypothetical protein